MFVVCRSLSKLFAYILLCYTSISSTLAADTLSLTRNGFHHPISIQHANPQQALHPRQDVSLDGSLRNLFIAAETANGIVVQTAYTPAHIDIPTVCPLWDDTCKGDHTEALLTFFNHTIVNLFADDCFIDDGHGNGGGGDLFDPKCTLSDVPASSSSIRSRVKSYMRQPACSIAGQQAASMYSYLAGDASCCSACEVGGINVDVFYWPSPDADTSCLKIIGDSVRPPLEGATTSCPPGPTTTSNCNTYWG